MLLGLNLIKLSNRRTNFQQKNLEPDEGGC